MPSATRFDLVVIGSGNAGQAAARVGREQGLRVAVVDRRAPGGTCALRGCVPKKVLVAAAEVLDTLRRAGVHGIRVGPAQLDWAALIARERAFVEGTPAEVTRSLEQGGIDLIRGEARFVDRTVLVVDGTRIEAAHFVVATGSRPRPLGVPGADLLLTSDDLLERTTLPASVAFLGTGVIAFEFAHVMVRAGARVVLAGGRVLDAFDPVVVERLVRATRALGVDIAVGERVRAIERVADGVRVHLDGPAGAHALDASVAVNATGRVPDLDDLDLAAAGIDTSDGLALDEALRSRENPAISFAGDAVPSSPQLSPVASWEGSHAALHVHSSAAAPLDYTGVPRVVFTIPALAAVGLDERAAARAGLEVDIRDNDMVGWRSSRTHAEEHAFARVLTERGTGRIVGATLLGHGAAEVIHALAAAVRERRTADDLKATVYAYPTFHADLKYLVG